MWRGCTEVEEEGEVEVEEVEEEEAGREAGREMVRGIAISISAREVRCISSSQVARSRLARCAPRWCCWAVTSNP